jgi:hypothetical protein
MTSSKDREIRTPKKYRYKNEDDDINEQFIFAWFLFY